MLWECYPTRCLDNTDFPRTKTEDAELQVFATTAYNLQRCIQITDAGGLILTKHEAAESSSCLQKFLAGWVWLAANFVQKRQMLFLLRPKHHCLHHQAVQMNSWRINQRLFSTMDDESFLGKIKHIYTSCHGRTASARMYSRYLLVLAMVLEEHRRLDDLE